MENTENQNIKLPQPDELTRREKEDAAGAYIMLFSGLYIPLPLTEIVMSVAYYLYFRKKSRFIAFHSYQSLITQFPISFFNTIFTVWLILNIINVFAKQNFSAFNSYFLIYFIFVLLWNLTYIVYFIIGYVQAGKGKLFYMLLFGKIAYLKFYGPDSKFKLDENKSLEQNIPPKGF